MTATAERYATAAELLRRLASRLDRLPGDDGDPATLTGALGVAAQACGLVDQAAQACGLVDQAAKERDLAEQAAAQACEQLEEANEVAEQEREEAMLYAAHLWSLLEQAAEAVATRLAAHDDADVSWETGTLAYELRQALDEAPDDLGARLGARLLDELRAARVALRAASGLAAAVHRGDATAVGQCLATFQHASRGWLVVAGTRRAVGEVGVAAGQGSR